MSVRFTNGVFLWGPDPDPAITFINLSPFFCECHCCGAETSGGFGVPVFEDLILHNDYEGEWGGAPACVSCFALQQLLGSPMPLHEFKKLRGDTDGE